jgi:predicted DNA binding CopG/RHH family protein
MIKMTKLEKEEKELLESMDKGEWKSIRRVKAEIKRHQKYAESTFKKDRRINIRISRKDLEAIQKRALEEGLPYQTLISSLLHKYVSGRLIEKDSHIAR